MVQGTLRPKPHEVEHEWIVLDAQDVVVGRLASFVVKRLRGKHRPDFSPEVDVGDHVIVVNAEKVALTGRKLTQKRYHRHTGYPGGIRSTTPEQILRGQHPERVLEKAVRRMMPRESSLARRQLSKLRVYSGSEHPHEAQKPIAIDFAEKNRKNTRRRGPDMAVTKELKETLEKFYEDRISKDMADSESRLLASFSKSVGSLETKLTAMTSSLDGRLLEIEAVLKDTQTQDSVEQQAQTSELKEIKKLLADVLARDAGPE